MNILKRAIGLFLLLVLCLGAAGGHTSAQTPGQALEISPPLIELKADPGQTLNTQLRIRNVTQGTLITKAQINDFTAGEDEGQPKILFDEKETSPYTLKSWVSPIPDATLQKSQQLTVPVTLTVPKDASPGGHYGVVRFTGLPPELADQGVALSASVGTLFLVNVSGNIKESADISKIVTLTHGQPRNLFEYGPVTIDTYIKNTGNVHIKPKGTMRITDIFGKEKATYTFNATGGNVLPASTRKFEYVFNKKLLFGPYKVTADLVYGSKNTIVSSTHTFWVIPYKLILGVLGLLAILLFAIRQYNRYIVKRAQKTKTNAKTKKPKKGKKAASDEADSES
jgi:hypothetical protein